jgi:SAM-dependent methyltransferase
MTSTFSRRMRLAHDILSVHYMMPATALWRLFEVEVVLDHMRATGRGLDVGCGDGRLAEVYLSGTKAVRWTGLELDERDVELARRRSVYTKVHHESATKISEPDRSFDIVFANSVLEHMPPLDAVLAEVARVLKPGGKFAFTVPAPAMRTLLPRTRLLRALGMHRRAERYGAALDARVAHVNYLSAQDWERRLAAVGMKVTTTRQFVSKRTLAWWSRIAATTGGLAWTLTAGRMTPRQVQQQTGMVDRDRPFLGRIAWCVLWPVLAWTSMEREPREFAGLYVEAVRE